VLTVLGTRPEAIKLAPVIRELDACEAFQSIVCTTSQHRDMVNSILDLFGIRVDYDLDVMTENQSLDELTCKVLMRTRQLLEELRPDCLVVQGDTTTVMAASLAAFYEKVPVAHVEAGLRTDSIHSPWPEEMNRRVTSQLARWHFAPTETAARNLREESVPHDSIFVTGNTVVDALLMIVSKQGGIRNAWKILISQCPNLDPEKRLILVTTHRRESFGEGLANTCAALKVIAARDDIQLLLPVHMNPNVHGPVHEFLGSVANVHLVPPLQYNVFVAALRCCSFVMTDSGGVQEEAPTFGKPVLVLRENTERNEAVDAGGALLVGVSVDCIVEHATRLMDDVSLHRGMSKGKNPFGDGHSSVRIAEILRASVW
jgi:UDP-N-acetylglucosamine 2-epimerase (non-hydrolysing)